VVRSAVTASGDDAEDNRRADAWTDVRAADLRSALDRLAVLDRAPGPLTGLVDLRFVAVAGQSLGGAAAAQAAQQDHRFAAVVDMDGFPRALAPYPQPSLALVAGNGTGDAAADRAYADAVAELLANRARVGTA